MCDKVKFKPEATVLNSAFCVAKPLESQRDLQCFVAPAAHCLSSRDGLQIETSSDHMFKKEESLQKI